MGNLMNEKIESIDIKKLRKLIRELFKHYGRKEVYEDEFYEYFRNKGFSDEEIERLWIRAISRSGIVKWGVYVEADQLPPKKIKEKTFLELIR